MQDQMNSVARFLDARGRTQDALEVATDPDYRFELAVQLGKLDTALQIAEDADSEGKWRQLSELAMSSGKLQVQHPHGTHVTPTWPPSCGVSQACTLSVVYWKCEWQYVLLQCPGKLEQPDMVVSQPKTSGTSALVHFLSNVGNIPAFYT